MPAYLHLLRQFHLVQRLQAVRGRALPFAELRRYLLEHPSMGDYGGYELRTFQHEVVDLFGISIKSRQGQGYYIAETEQLPPDWPQLFAAVEIQAFLRLPPALAPFVQPETRRPLVSSTCGRCCGRCRPGAWSISRTRRFATTRRGSAP